jgi:putative membrane protein
MRAAGIGRIGMAAIGIDAFSQMRRVAVRGRILMKRLIAAGGLLTLAAIALNSVSAVPAAAQPYYGPHMWGGGWWMLGSLTMILFVGAVIVVLVLLFRRRAPRQDGPGVQSMRTPLDILQERFARGEIDKDEYTERRRVLGV